jgi:thymidylate synthase
MNEFHRVLQTVLNEGETRGDRTGTGTRSIFGMQSRYNLQNGFPAVTTKKLQWKPVVGELLWFLSGSTNVEDLRRITWGEGSTKKTVWDDNYNHQAQKLGYSNGELGPIYGKQWRDFAGVDQIAIAADQLKNSPNSRRIIVSAWNPTELDQQSLPPCHTMFQFYVSASNKLSCQLYQRSCDLFLGGPFNIASYSLLVHIMARISNLEVGEFVWTIGDAHIYGNHIDQVQTQLERTPLQLPQLVISEHIRTLQDVLSSTVDDYKLVGYEHHGVISAPMAV